VNAHSAHDTAWGAKRPAVGSEDGSKGQSPVCVDRLRRHGRAHPRRRAVPPARRLPQPSGWILAVARGWQPEPRAGVQRCAGRPAAGVIDHGPVEVGQLDPRVATVTRGVSRSLPGTSSHCSCTRSENCPRARHESPTIQLGSDTWRFVLLPSSSSELPNPPSTAPRCSRREQTRRFARSRHGAQPRQRSHARCRAAPAKVALAGAADPRWTPWGWVVDGLHVTVEPACSAALPLQVKRHRGVADRAAGGAPRAWPARRHEVDPRPGTAARRRDASSDCGRLIAHSLQGDSSERRVQPHSSRSDRIRPLSSHASRAGIRRRRDHVSAHMHRLSRAADSKSPGPQRLPPPADARCV
jgi:hypothetical protein